MVKENTELKAVLYEAESAGKNPGKAPTGDKKLAITEEIRQILAEVVYVYKTLDTNAKQFMADFQEKRENAQKLVSRIADLPQMKRDMQVATVKELAKDVVFLRGFPNINSDALKVILACLSAESARKQEKVQRYDDEIAKFSTMLGVSKAKVDEYEQKLSFYY